jgi:hypothetical protein
MLRGGWWTKMLSNGIWLFLNRLEVSTDLVLQLMRIRLVLL